MMTGLEKFIAGTVGKSRVAKFLAFYVFHSSITALASSEPGINLSGTYEYALAKPFYSTRYNFQACVAGDAWIIKYGQIADIANAETLNENAIASCDGTNIYLVRLQNQRGNGKAWNDPSGSAKDQPLGALAVIYPGIYPPSEDFALQNIWRAFASGSALAGSQGKTKPPFVVDLATFYDTNYYCNYFWETNGNQRGGRRLILKDNGQSEIVISVKGRKEYARYTPPYDQGFTNGLGVWQEVTNLAGFLVPTDFEFTAFSPKEEPGSPPKPRADPELRVSYIYQCIVTNIARGPIPQIPPVLPPGKVIVTDRRLNKSGPPRQNYLATTNWLHEPIDPGELAASLGVKLKIGDAAPDFAIETLDGKLIKLSDLRGKYVLLDFWATTCVPCIGEIPSLKATFDAFGGDGRFALISLSEDISEKEPRIFVAEKSIPWTQGYLDKQSKSSVERDYGFIAIPQVLLVGPDGKLAAKDLRGTKIREAVARALKR